VLEAARRSGLTVGLRGAGRTYGDGALNSGHIVLDLRPMNLIPKWDPHAGMVTVEPGVTIQQLWQHVLADGWWPPVVPGTMFPTLGGALAMNIHGKNNYRAGTLGEHVVEFTLLFPTGEVARCSPEQNGDLFYAAIGGAGLLGVFTSITLRLKKIWSGDVRVRARALGNLLELLREVDRGARDHEYSVGWVDATNGNGVGCGQTHVADYLGEGEDDAPNDTLKTDHQTLPAGLGRALPGVPLWRLMRMLMNNAGVRAINAAKYRYARLGQHDAEYRQALVPFNFLLDYVPGWERAYGPEGLIQYQSFVPADAADGCYTELIRRSIACGLPSYLGVAKRHRADRFLLSHAVDGFSLALDFKVTRANAARLQRLTREMTEIVLQAGGRFYFAKDCTLTRDAAAQYLGTEALRRFHLLKQRCDPDGILQTDLYRRLLAV
jgi:FAD/FMN-containing dehydrogenase